LLLGPYRASKPRDTNEIHTEWTRIPFGFNKLIPCWIRGDDFVNLCCSGFLCANFIFLWIFWNYSPLSWRRGQRIYVKFWIFKKCATFTNSTPIQHIPISPTLLVISRKRKKKNSFRTTHAKESSKHNRE